MPEGGGAEAGRGRSLSVERLTAVTDRSATGISEDSLAALPALLPRPWPLPTTLRPWSVLPGARVQRRQAGRAGSSQVKSSQPGRRPGEATLTQRCRGGDACSVEILIVHQDGGHVLRCMCGAHGRLARLTQGPGLKFDRVKNPPDHARDPGTVASKFLQTRKLFFQLLSALR